MLRRNRIVRGLSIGIAAAAFLSVRLASQQTASPHRALLDQYCVMCHNQQAKTAGLMLDKMDLAHIPEGAETWEKVIRKLRGGMMPPQGRPRPPQADVESFVSFLETSIDRAAATKPNPGRAALHRLNRTEYGNAIRDLLDLEVDVTELLPADDESNGFDNIADVLKVSPPLVEQYLAASRKISSLAVGDPSIVPITQIYRTPPDLSQRDHIEGLPLGTRGGLLIRHIFPLDAEYDLRVVLLRNVLGYLTGLEWPHRLEVTVDGEQVFMAPVGGEDDNRMSDTNFAFAADALDERLKMRIPVKAGPHVVGVSFLRKNAAESDEPLELHTRDHDLQNMNGIPLINHVDITGPFQAIGPGDTPSRRKIFSCRPVGGDGVGGPSDRQSKEAGAAGVPSVGRTVGPTLRNGVGGPSDRQSKEAGTSGVPSVDRTVGPTPRNDETACARKILSTLGRRAYRQPASAADIDLLMAFYQSARARRGFEAGIQNALQLILATPKFLFRSEPDPANIPPRGAYRLGDFELASRLSFFLWSSIPDDELLNVAAQGKLKDPAVLDAQVKRMLSDRRSEALVTNFAGQWLFLRNLQSARPDGELFPNFDDNLRQAFRRESELFFESIMRENRSVLDLLNANYTYVNERLARHYGIPNVYGTHFRRVTLTDDNRRGLLSQGSILTVTSYPNRTSPVLRGKWILENIMGTPPPAPPANVPPLKENEQGAKTPRSVRELVEEHRKSPTCSGCHSVMDPLGFSLENFDATGEWRIKDGSGPIDVSGQLADGTKVDGPVSLRQAILKHPEQFARTLTEKLLTYALGRGLEYYDTSVVRGIVREAARNDYRFSDLIAGIVKSAPFQMKVKTNEDSKL